MKYCTFDIGIEYVDILTNAAGATSQAVQYVHVHSGVKGTSGSKKTIEVPVRGQSYSYDYYATNSVEEKI